jgi:hypothetical protein
MAGRFYEAHDQLVLVQRLTYDCSPGWVLQFHDRMGPELAKLSTELATRVEQLAQEFAEAMEAQEETRHG